MPAQTTRRAEPALGTRQAAPPGSAAKASGAALRSLWRRALGAVGTGLAWPFVAAWRLARALRGAVVRLWYAVTGRAAAPSSKAPPPSFGQRHLARANATLSQRAHNRARYLEAMARQGVWGGELELHLLAELAQVRVQVWGREPSEGGEVYVCSAVRGVEQADRVVHLELRRQHYSVLIPATGEERSAGGTARPPTAFFRLPIPANGDCQFLALAYGADLPHARRLLAHRCGLLHAPEGELRADATLQHAFRLDGARFRTDAAFVLQALAVLVTHQRAALVRELRKPAYAEQLDALVVQELAEAAP